MPGGILIRPFVLTMHRDVESQHDTSTPEIVNTPARICRACAGFVVEAESLRIKVTEAVEL